MEEPDIMPHPDDSVQPKFDRLDVNQASSPDSPQFSADWGKYSGAKNRQSKAIGKVFLVGAGPGDPGLITVRGVQCLQQADVVLFDGLANTALLSYAPNAERICVGKHGTVPIWSQAMINQRLVELAEQGKVVVRLKAGDSAIFARTAEELEALERHQIPFEVVPGITAALALAGYSGIPLTHRDHASAVALVTGQQHEEAPEAMDWAALATFPGTLIVYMGVTTSGSWTAALMAGGKPGYTPCALVRRCSWKDQLVIRCRLDEVAERLTPASKLRPPVLVVIGEVAALGMSWNWFESLPLRGMGIWLPRALHQASPLQQSLESLGAQVYVEPLFEVHRPRNPYDMEQAIAALVEQLGLPPGQLIGPLTEPSGEPSSVSPDASSPDASHSVYLDASLDASHSDASQLRVSPCTDLPHDMLKIPTGSVPTPLQRQPCRTSASCGRIDGITFSSPNGVRHFMQFLQEKSLDSRIFANLKIAVVGPGTAAELAKYGLRADYQPDMQYSAADLVDSMRSSVANQHWLVTQTNHSQDTLTAGLRQAGCWVTECLTYETVDRAEITHQLIQDVESGRINTAIISSVHIAELAAKLLGPLKNRLRTIALGQRVAQALEKFDWPAAAVTMKNSVDEIINSAITLSGVEREG